MLDYTYTNLVLMIGGQLLFIIIGALVVTFGLSTEFPSNAVREMLGATTSGSNNASKAAVAATAVATTSVPTMSVPTTSVPTTAVPATLLPTLAIMPGNNVKRAAVAAVGAFGK